MVGIGGWKSPVSKAQRKRCSLKITPFIKEIYQVSFPENPAGSCEFLIDRG